LNGVVSPAKDREERRRTLRLSHKEAAAGALTTATSDNFLNAFAVYLNASALQLGGLAAIPQLAGGTFQFAALVLDRLLPRRALVVVTALLQGVAVAGIAFMAAGLVGASVALMMVLVSINQAALNLAQPHWRAWLGRLVPPRRRGRFFAARTRIVMLCTILVFAIGGYGLSVSASYGAAGLGFAMLFGIASVGRLYAARTIARMHDPDASGSLVRSAPAGETLRRIVDALRDPLFRNYTLFTAALQGAVALTAPFFTVYMLRDLHFTYLEFAVNTAASIATQFVMLPAWGRIADRYGNLFIMRATSRTIVLVPLLWVITPNPLFLLLAQVVAGIAWSGFSLSSATYLYDVRPQHTHLATYAAVQAGVAALAICIGALLGGVVAHQVPDLATSLPFAITSPLLIVFFIGCLLRGAVVAWFEPRMATPSRHHPKLMEVILRVAQVNSISGVVLDLLTIGRRSKPRK
jgi:hypothetical protein